MGLRISRSDIRRIDGKGCCRPPSGLAHGYDYLRQKSLRMLQLLREIRVDHVIEPMLREGLLLGADAHGDELVDGVLPGFVVEEERIRLECVFGALDVDFLCLLYTSPS